jgi:hypothetical protein
MAYDLTVNAEAEGTVTQNFNESTKIHMWYSLNDGVSNTDNHGYSSCEDANLLTRLRIQLCETNR